MELCMCSISQEPEEGMGELTSVHKGGLAGVDAMSGCGVTRSFFVLSPAFLPSAGTGAAQHGP
jgi:hypothetical protein